MPTEQLEKYFSRQGKLVTYNVGETILQPGSLPEYLYYLKTGVITAYSIDKTGVQHIHMFLRHGKVFPLMRSLLGRTNQITCLAKTDVELYAVPTKNFIVELKTNLDLNRALLYMAVSNFAISTNRIENLQYSSARERILYRLLTLAHSFGEVSEKGITIDLNLSHEEIAASVQVSREVVTRTLRKLQAEQIVNYNRKTITIYPDKAIVALRDRSLSLSDFGLTDQISQS